MRLIMEQGKKWKEIIMNEGWEYTIDGWLSPDDIEKSGIIYKEGNWFIPTQEYIAEETKNGYKKGQKYRGASEQYLKWKKEYKERRYGFDSIDDKIQREMEMEIKIDEPEF